MPHPTQDQKSEKIHKSAALIEQHLHALRWQPDEVARPTLRSSHASSSGISKLQPSPKAVT